MVIIGIMGKSGTGKSTLIEGLCKSNPLYKHITSYTTRGIRKDDPNDINTHVFVDDDFWSKHKDKAWAVYHDKVNGYYNWTDETLFDPHKINLYAIDSKAFADLTHKHSGEHFFFGIYLDLDWQEREQRLFKRDGVTNAPAEEHLSERYISLLQNKAVVDITNMSKKQVQEVVGYIIQAVTSLAGYTILNNSVRCKKCDSIIYSRYTHDFHSCDCGAISIDGGFEYCRAVGDLKDIERYPIILYGNKYDVVHNTTRKIVKQK